MRATIVALLPPFVAVAFACSAFDPRVGPEQDTCGVETAGVTTAPGTGYGSSAGGGTQASTTSTACSPDGGDACENCESQFCCAARVACYSDPVCGCADRALDRCDEAAGSDPKRRAACYAPFTGEGTVEKARVACLRTWCQGACQVP